MANFKVSGNLNTTAGRIDATEIRTYPTSGGGQGNRVDIEAKSGNYIRYGNGLQICWETFSSGGDGDISISFPMPFKYTPVILTGVYGTNYRDTWEHSAITSRSPTGFIWRRQDEFGLMWLAYGTWK